MREIRICDYSLLWFYCSTQSAHNDFCRLQSLLLKIYTREAKQFIYYNYSFPISSNHLDNLTFQVTWNSKYPNKNIWRLGVKINILSKQIKWISFPRKKIPWGTLLSLMELASLLLRQSEDHITFMHEGNK